MFGTVDSITDPLGANYEAMKIRPVYLGCFILLGAFALESVILWGLYIGVAWLLGIPKLSFWWFVLIAFVLNIGLGFLRKYPVHLRRRAGRN